MKRVLNTTLVADGSSDRVLIPIIQRLMQVHCPYSFRETDFVQDYPGETSRLTDRLRYAVAEYPCDILFVHRDAEQRGAGAMREAEIRAAVAELGDDRPAIAIVPVRMTEAWLLVDESAIRHAAGNPSGREPLQLPEIQRIESVNAKQVLFDALSMAKNLNGRRTRRLKPEALRHRVADYLDDLSLLRQLDSFSRFEAQLRDHFQSAGFVDAQL